MKNSLKYIKIKGTLQSRGEYTTDPAEYRPYEAVTIVDDEGEEVHFYTLSMSKRMDDDLDFDQSMSFYILRHRVKDKMGGFLYAVECAGKKIFYPDTAIPYLKDFVLTSSGRYPYIINSSAPVAALIVSGVLTVALYVALGAAFGLTDKIMAIALVFGVLSFGLTGFYMYSPVIFKTKRAGLSEMKKNLTDDGFDTTSGNNSKY